MAEIRQFSRKWVERVCPHTVGGRARRRHTRLRHSGSRGRPAVGQEHTRRMRRRAGGVGAQLRRQSYAVTVDAIGGAAMISSSLMAAMRMA